MRSNHFGCIKMPTSIRSYWMLFHCRLYRGWGSPFPHGNILRIFILKILVKALILCGFEKSDKYWVCTHHRISSLSVSLLTGQYQSKSRVLWTGKNNKVTPCQIYSLGAFPFCLSPGYRCHGLRKRIANHKLYFAVNKRNHTSQTSPPFQVTTAWSKW